MENSSSCDELTVRKQFHKLCIMSMKREVIDYNRHEDYMRQHEKLFSDLSENELNQLAALDNYSVESNWFQALGYDIEVKDQLLAQSLKELPEKKRNIILLSFYMDMSDAEIGRRMHLDRSTICEHRKNLLIMLKKMMEKKTNEK